VSHDHRSGLHDGLITQPDRLVAECNAAFAAPHRLFGDVRSLIASLDRADRAARYADQRVACELSRRRLIASRRRIISFCECFVSSRERFVSS
jgi:hypothetical protein